VTTPGDNLGTLQYTHSYEGPKYVERKNLFKTRAVVLVIHGMTKKVIYASPSLISPAFPFYVHT
jgi:hypothetical protein